VIQRPTVQRAPQHYRAYQPKPLTKQDVDQVEILFGGLHWRAERLIQATFENRGYKARPLPAANKADLLLGRELADIGQCCPTSFTTGNLANFLRGEADKSGLEHVARKFAYVTAGSCGACRFGQYHQSYELALRNLGLEDFRMFLIEQDKMDQGPLNGGGLDLNMPFTLGLVWSVLCADVLQSLEYQIRPYEVEKGATQRAVERSVDQLYETFKKRPLKGKKWGALMWHLSTEYFVSALRDVKKNFDSIEVDRLQCKPVVKITGEFYLQTVEGDPNYNIHSWLESEGAEVYPAPVAVWLDYWMRFYVQIFEDYRSIDRFAGAKITTVKVLQRAFHWTYRRLRAALGNIPHELPDQYELRRLAAPYYHHRLSGGEGDMLVGKALWAHLNKKAHMICELSPYACMPNTMSVGAMAGVLGKHPDLLYAPIEVKGDAEVHALSRCQMILAEAKKRAITEYVKVMEMTDLTPEDAKKQLDATPHMKRATYPLPRKGAAGVAASLLLHLAQQRFKRGVA
jgi:predicted nucleotide-binding protein (sugar kinase/HSP70/actin superfamily)